MRRFLSLLLIPMLALGQTLSHSHAGTGVLEPADHAQRPHIHLGSHSHDQAGDHSHEVRDSVDDADTAPHLTEQPAHDADVVYLPGSDLARSRAVSSFSPIVGLDALTGTSADGSAGVGTDLGLPRIGPPNSRSGLPVYLLTASLRL